tara:strand:- start:106 stop:822 length:717 start_codon:yes stop_codon:yes gene_type:complete
MKVLIILLISALTFLNHKNSENKWIYIFDGKTLDGWHNYNSNDVGSQWSVENGELVFTNNNESYQDLLTEKEYTNFELSIEWNISKGGNSGIFYGVKEFPEFNDAHTTGPEIQVLDNKNFYTTTELHKAPSLYDLISSDSKDLIVKPHGQWNHLTLKIDHKNNLGTVKLNGQLAFSYSLSGEVWDELVSNSKFRSRTYSIKNKENKRIPTFGVFKTGKIGLQDHGSDVRFRNIKIREF